MKSLDKINESFWVDLGIFNQKELLLTGYAYYKYIVKEGSFLISSFLKENH